MMVLKVRFLYCNIFWIWFCWIWCCLKWMVLFCVSVCGVMIVLLGFWFWCLWFLVELKIRWVVLILELMIIWLNFLIWRNFRWGLKFCCVVVIEFLLEVVIIMRFLVMGFLFWCLSVLKLFGLINLFGLCIWSLNCFIVCCSDMVRWWFFCWFLRRCGVMSLMMILRLFVCMLDICVLSWNLIFVNYVLLRWCMEWVIVWNCLLVFRWMVWRMWWLWYVKSVNSKVIEFWFNCC